MSTEFFRKYIDIINESSRAVDPDQIAKALTKLAKNQLDQAREAKVQGNKKAALFRQEHGKKILSLIPEFQRSWAQGFTKLREIDREESMSERDSDFAGDVLEGLESILNADWIYKEYYHGDWKNQVSEGLSKKAMKLIQDYRALYPKIAYDSNGDDLMEPEEAHDETCDQLGVDPAVMDRYLELETDALVAARIAKGK
jgi:hypothetical protein